MLVEPVSAHAGVTSPMQIPGGQASDSPALSEMFLQILIKELSNQDPLNPMDGTDFVTQLAQLSAVEQLQTMSSTLKALQEMQQVTQASALIGLNVRATGEDGSVIEGRVTAANLTDGEIMLDVDGGYTIPISAVSAISSPPAEAMFDESLASWLFGDIAAPTDIETWFNPYQTELDKNAGNVVATSPAENG